MSLRLKEKFVSSNYELREKSLPAKTDAGSDRRGDFIAISVVFGFFLIYGISTLIWGHLNRVPPAWDPSDHYISAYEYYSLAHSSLREFFHDFFTGLHYYPPIFHLGVAFFFSLFGAGSVQAILINIVALFVL